MIVRENINFERGGKPLDKMGIGRLKLINNWIEEMQQFNIINSPWIWEWDNQIFINANDVDLSETLFNEFPDYIKFGNIHMDFRCYIKSPLALKAFPGYVGREMTVYYPKSIEKPCTPEDIRKICEVNGYVIVEHYDE